MVVAPLSIVKPLRQQQHHVMDGAMGSGWQAQTRLQTNWWWCNHHSIIIQLTRHNMVLHARNMPRTEGAMLHPTTAARLSALSGGM